MATDDLDEKNFIKESYSKNPWPYWIFALFFLLLSLTVWYFNGTKPKAPSEVEIPDQRQVPEDQ